MLCCRTLFFKKNILLSRLLSGGGIWGAGLYIFRELGSNVNYFRGSGEQAPFCLIQKKNHWLLGGEGGGADHPCKM